MSSITNTNVAANSMISTFNRNNIQMNEAMTRVATARRINSVKDNASVWAITEKMRERIRSNNQASQNIQNDTAMIKVAQGGVSNTIDILTTLKERAINAANDSNRDSDRAVIAEEVRQLLNQIDDNAQKVKFNERVLLNGSAADDNSTATSLGTDPAPVTAASSSSGSSGVTNNLTDANVVSASSAAKEASSNVYKLGGFTATSTKFNTIGGMAVGDTITVKSGNTTIAEYTIANANDTAQKLIDASGGAISYYNKNTNIGTVTESDGTTPLKTTNDAAGAALYIVGDYSKVSVEVTRANATGGKDTVTAAQTALEPTAYAKKAGATNNTAGDPLTFHVGGEANMAISVTMPTMTVDAIFNGQTSTSFAEMFLSKSALENGDGSNSVTEMIDTALNNALKEQAKLGAIENRLGYTADNVDTMNENLETAISSYRDADLAKEMSNYMKYAVLSQASQLMLAQANQNGYSILSLLQQ